MEETTPSAALATGDTDLSKRRVSRGVDDMNQPQSAISGMHKANARVRPGSASVAGGALDEEASDEEQAEHDRALQALSEVLYKNERTSNAVAQQLTPEEKVGSIAKASLMVLTQLDQKFDFDEVVVAELTKETVDRVADMYENVHGEEISDQELQSILGATWEGVMEVFGVDEDTYAELTAGMSDEEFGGYEQQYKQFLGEGGGPPAPEATSLPDGGV